jgi:DNA-binding protein H-NS
MRRQTSAAMIRARIRKLEKQAQRLERSASKGLRAAAAVIDKFGLSLAEVTAAFSLTRKRGKRGGSGRPVPVKYADRKGNKWTGRGRSPLWLVAAEKAGKKRESFLVKAK